MTLEERLSSIRKRVDKAALAADRSPKSVQLVAVTKTHPLTFVQRAADVGQVHFGESYAQELRDKARDLPSVQWHFIGRIQRNKAKYISPVAFRIHALESVPQAEALAARATDTLNCLVAVNIGREASKSGVLPNDLPKQLDALAAVPGIRLTGLMCIPPRVADSTETAPFFEEMASLAAEGVARGHQLDELSMGMSSDFEVAIRHGATWVRVGTAIFGIR
jgi:hypothetical protein